MNIFLRFILFVFFAFAGQSYATTAVAYGYEVNVFQAGVENLNNNGLINPSGCCSKLSSRDSQDRAQAGAFFALAAGFDVPKSTSFKNLRPSDPILTPSTDTIVNIQKTTQSGRFNYVITQDGKLVLGRSGQSRPNGHINLAQGQDVLAAGEAKFVNGQLRYIDNFSGHYRPSGKAAQNAALQAFERAGVKPSQGYIERKF